ncbi:DUF4209 domain-containing protein [Buttiauxella selenatireducens]|uniref:DUF4209 domain-containing protein n=1 Tax=Buttiauxella selenatireducens TaxID=3073902 RepID=A0ABY9SEC3_9ENTR|nr:DUF4209 domain-containing protein [Buttiauxella sp. R73]WMY75744.1 DUF4209 domain-containing protein [Buttiauxella sp. R73]
MNNTINYDDIDYIANIVNGTKMDGYSCFELIKNFSNNYRSSCKDVIDLLVNIVNAKIDIKKRNSPYRDLSTNKIFSDILSDKDLEVIKELAPKIIYSPLRGRLYDFLWLYKKGRDRNYALEAIKSYSSLTIEDNNWHTCVSNCFQRALQLSFIHPENEFCKEVEDKIMSCFMSTANSFLFVEMASLITSTGLKKDIYELINKRMRKGIYYFLNKNDYTSANRCLIILNERYKTEINAGNGDHKCQLVNIAQARALTDEGNQYDGLIAIGCYQNALKHYKHSKLYIRAMFRVDEEIIGLKRKIRTQGKHASESMVIIKTEPVNISEEVKKAIEHVSDKPDVMTAIVHFCFLKQGFDKSVMIQNTLDLIKNHPLQNLFSQTVIDSDGRVVGGSDGIDVGSADVAEIENIIVPLSQGFAQEVSYNVSAYILPALYKLTDDHYIDYGMVKEICEKCGFISPNKTELFSQALQFGFEGNYSVSVHLLAPLVEDTIRKILYDQGDYTAIIDNNSKSTEVSINTLLSKNTAQEVFDCNFLFELKMLLTNHVGSNIRNSVAHGLLDDNTSQGYDVVYLWWRILRWIVLSVVLFKNEYKDLTVEVSG